MSSNNLVVFSLLEMLDKLMMFVDLYNDIDACDTSNKLFKVQQIDGKGYGMIAAQTIKPFAVILIEKALLMEPRNIETSLVEELHNQFRNNLSKSQQSLILDLSNCTCENNVKGIYSTNCVGTTDSAHHTSALFAAFSRVNHSCLPNCCMYYEGKPTNCIILKSLFPINKNDEITIGYIPRLLHKYHERQEILQNSYGFKCKCKEMCAFGTKYDDLIGEYRECIANTDSLESIKRAMDILNTHFNGYPSVITHLYNICADICVNNKLYDDAIDYVKQSIDVHLKCYGIYKRDRWETIHRKIILIKYKNNFDSKYDILLKKYNYLFKS